MECSSLFQMARIYIAKPAQSRALSTYSYRSVIAFTVTFTVTAALTDIFGVGLSLTVSNCKVCKCPPEERWKKRSGRRWYGTIPWYKVSS